MYLLLNNEEKIIVNSVSDIEQYDVSDYKIYSLVPVENSVLFEEGTIRDKVFEILKGKQMPKDEVVCYVYDNSESTITKINKVISKMKKEKLIFAVDDLYDKHGNKWIGME